MVVASRLARSLRLFGLAEIPVFVVVGPGGAERADELEDTPGLRRVESPREAALLAVCGTPPMRAADPVRRLYHALPRPRAAVWLGERRPQWLWTSAGERLDVGELRERLADGGDALEDAPPVVLERTEWRGVGPYGQGGEGMMGGRPYGRTIAMTGPDRDGLELDVWIAHLGPYFPCLPPGLELRLELQGDVVTSATVVGGYMAAEHDRERPWRRLGRDGEPFGRALLGEQVTAAELGRARARSHLRWLVCFLRLAGLDAPAREARALVSALEPRRLAALAARVRRDLLLRSALKGLAPIAPGRGNAIGGPVAGGGDAYARLLRRLGEIERALAAEERPATDEEAAEGPRGRIEWGGAWRTPSFALRELAAELAPGLEWSRLVLAVASLDIDVEEAEA